MTTSGTSDESSDDENSDKKSSEDTEDSSDESSDETSNATDPLEDLIAAPSQSSSTFQDRITFFWKYWSDRKSIDIFMKAIFYE